MKTHTTPKKQSSSSQSFLFPHQLTGQSHGDLLSTKESSVSRVLSTVCVRAQACLTLFNPMDCSLTGSTVHGSFQARVLELPFPTPPVHRVPVRKGRQIRERFPFLAVLPIMLQRQQDRKHFLVNRSAVAQDLEIPPSFERLQQLALLTSGSIPQGHLWSAGRRARWCCSWMVWAASPATSWQWRSISYS